MWLFSCGIALALPAPQGTVVQLTTGPHAAQVQQFGAAPTVASVPRRGAMAMATSGPDMTVYGYLAYWNDDLNTVPWDELTHIAIFNADVNTDGTLSNTANWDIADDAVAMGAPYGVDVHLVVTNFNPTELSTLLSSSSSRTTLINELVSWQASTGAHGINIDFEGLPLDVRDEMVTFVTDLEAAVGDVVLATPSVDWAGSWNYSALTDHADLFIMGYGYHWGGSGYAGPTDPLFAGGGTVWDGVNSYSLSWSLDDYIASGADPDRIILGLPLYGMTWPTSGSGVPATTLATGTSTVFSTAWDLEAIHGRSFEPDSLTPYLHDGSSQTWYGDVDSVQDRIVYARDDAGVAGIGFWALHYADDDPAMWDMIAAETQSLGGSTPTDPTGTTTPGTTPGTTVPGTTEPTGPTGPGTTGPAGDPAWVANPGRPFLAYVDDIVMLSAEGSLVPAGETPIYRWDQVQGPAVSLVDDGTMNPTFVVKEVGNVVFELQVGDGADTWSEPALSHVIVIDPDLPNRHEARGCGCAVATGSGLGGWLVALVGTLAVRRRRRHDKLL